MKLRIALAAAALCTFAVPVAIEAQTCTGSASFSAGNMRLGATGSFTDGAKTLGGAFTVGATQGLFASVAVSQISYNDLSGTSSVIGGSVGYSAKVGSAAEFCPIASYSHASFPKQSFFGGTITSGEDEFGLGGSFGIVSVMTPNLSLKPFVSAEYLHSTVNEHDSTLGSSSTNYDYGLLGVGLGLIVDKSLTIVPGIAQPVGLKGAKIAFNVAVAVNFGHFGAPAK
ncbi:MAG: hypothetical protein ACREN6_11795 [Gemmatimonadaceae bacterium]